MSADNPQDQRAKRRALDRARYARIGKWEMRRSHLKRAYGITPAEFDAMVEHQDGRCAICGSEQVRFDRDGNQYELDVDHDHATGRVRGLLCTLCNNGIGKFQENPFLMRVAVAYLENFNHGGEV